MDVVHIYLLFLWSTVNIQIRFYSLLSVSANFALYTIFTALYNKVKIFYVQSISDVSEILRQDFSGV